MLIFHTYSNTWVFQEEWKKAHTLPTYFKVQWNDLRINNPLSLTSIQCKTLEWLIPGTIHKESEKSNANQDGIKENIFYFKEAILIFFEVLSFPEK